VSGFVHLHNHTHYSLLDGACRIEDLIGAARQQGMPSIAMTDHGNLFAAVEFYQTAKSQGIHPIIGMEAYVATGSRKDRQPGREARSHHLVLLARNQEGYRNLLKLTSAAFLEGFYYKPRVDKDLLREHGAGLIGLSACLKGEVNQLVREDRFDEARATTSFYREIFDGDFYLELQDHGIPEESKANRRLIDLAGEMDVPLVVTNDCHYLRPEHSGAHDILLCIQTGKSRTDGDRLKYTTDQLYLKTAEEMYALFPGQEAALGNTLKIAERCQAEIEFGQLKLPHFPPPEPFADLASYLRHLCEEGVRRRYGSLEGVLRERLEYELGVIGQMGYEGYFLIVQDFINHARGLGVPVGPGRGSAAGSIVSYALGITNIDPIRYSLLFERFLNPERITMPDIDIDFSDRGRARVIQYVVDKYGAENVCQIITFGTMAARAVVRDVGRVMGLPYSEVDRIAKMIPAELGIKLEKALEQSPDLRALHDQDERVRELMSHARVLEGLSRHASTHAAGVVITPTPLTDYVPLYRGSDDETTTQFDMGACEKIGLLKIDFLGLRTLTVLQDCLESLRRREIEVDLDRIPLDDPAAFELVAAGDTVGVFQFESSGMAEYLRKLRPECLEDMIAMNALYRPGPLGSGMIEDFIQRKHGEKKIEYEHPLLEPILKETYGVIVYQEQVMQIASALAGYSLGEADLLRRAMGKKKAEIMAEQRAGFIERALARDVSKGVACRVFDLMAHFAGYGFNKSHSAGYALVAYQTAYLKAHYPVEFMAATLTSEMSNTDRVMILLAECRRMGIKVLAPDVNSSEEGFTVEGSDIRFGLGAVKGVGHNAVVSIQQGRADGPYRDLFDLCERIDPAAVNRKCLEALIHAGALDGCDPARARLAEGLPVAMEWAVRRRREKEMGQGSLFGAPGAGGLSPRPPLPQAEPWGAEETLRREKGALGFYISGHPMDAWRLALERLGSCSTHALADLADTSEVLVGGIPVQVKTSTDRKGGTMAFVTVEDFTGTLECVVFADAFAHYRAALTGDQPLLLKGKLSTREQEKPKILLEEALPLPDLMARGRLSLHLAVSASAPAEKLERLRDTLAAHPGACPVILHVDHQLLGGVQIRLSRTRVAATDPLLRRLVDASGASSLRLLVGDGRGRRSADIFPSSRVLPARRRALDAAPLEEPPNPGDATVDAPAHPAGAVAD